MRIHELAGNWGTARVTELGACVLSWRPAHGEDVLFVSRNAELTPGQMWHGGIPVCAPWFGIGRGDWEAPDVHGLVARVPWRTETVEQDDERARVVLTLASEEVTQLPGADRYPADLAYGLEVNVDAASLSVALTIDSPSTEVTVDVALHPYFRMDTASASLTGLEGVDFQDAADDWAPGRLDEPLVFGDHTDLVFQSAPSLFLSDGERTRRLTHHGATRTVVWNPGVEDQSLAEGEREEFVCVEFGNVRDGAVTIPAGGQHRLEMNIEV